MNSFIINWVPKHTGSIDFVSTNNPTEVKCPPDVQSIIRTDKDVRLCAIRYSNLRNKHALTGIQLIFTNGVETPFIETVKCSRGCEKPTSSTIMDLFSKQKVEVVERKTVEIDTNRTIRKVSVLIDPFGIKSIRLIDEEGNFIVNE